MSLQVFTGKMGLRDPDYLDITLQGNMRLTEKDHACGGHRGLGLFFAPSPELLYPYLSKRRFNRLKPGDWPKYAEAYKSEMRQRYRECRLPFDRLLELPRVVLLCFCANAEECHRTLLARDILPKLGAAYEGEIQRAAQARRSA